METAFLGALLLSWGAAIQAFNDTTFAHQIVTKNELLALKEQRKKWGDDLAVSEVDSELRGGKRAARTASWSSAGWALVLIGALYSAHGVAAGIDTDIGEVIRIAYWILGPVVSGVIVAALTYHHKALFKGAKPRLLSRWQMVAAVATGVIGGVLLKLLA